MKTYRHGCNGLLYSLMWKILGWLIHILVMVPLYSDDHPKKWWRNMVFKWLVFIRFELKLAVDSNNFSYIGNNILLDIYKPIAGHQQSIIDRILPILLWITWWQAVFQNELSKLICTSLYALIFFSFSLFRIRCFISIWYLKTEA